VAARPENVDVLFASPDPDERCRALRALFDGLRERALRVFAARFPGVPRDRVEECLDDAADDAALRGSRRTPPLGPEAAARYLFAAVRNRIISHLRRGSARYELPDQLLDRIADRLSDTAAGAAWRLCSPEERSEVRELLPHFIASLPPRQRLVLEVWLFWFPRSDEDRAFLRDRVAEVSGGPETVDAVDSALRVGKKKIRSAFSRAGYAFGEGGDA
jgi:DNA-directed RNA polymerase specialized sigma24 family protein